MDNKISGLQDDSFFNSSSEILVLGIGINGFNIISQVCESPLSGISYCSLDYKLREKIPFNKNVTCAYPNYPWDGIYWEYNIDNQFWEIYSINGRSLYYLIENKIKNLIIITSLNENKNKQFTYYICESCLLSQVHVFLIDIKQNTIKENHNNKESSIYNLESLYKDQTKNSCKQIFKKFEFNYELNLNGQNLVLFKIKEICKVLLKDNFSSQEILENDINENMPLYYGRTRIFADIILRLNKKEKFKNSEEAIEGLATYINESYIIDNLTYFSYRILCNIFSSEDLFLDGILNKNRFLQKFDKFKIFEIECNTAYNLWKIENIINIISFISTFREYKEPEQVRNDLFIVNNLGATALGNPLLTNWDRSIGIVINYPISIFIGSLKKKWDKIIINGILDIEKLRDVILGRQIKLLDKLKPINNTNKKESDNHLIPEILYKKYFYNYPICIKKIGDNYITILNNDEKAIIIPEWLENKIKLTIANYFLQKDK